jgi:hypothetical protein
MNYRFHFDELKPVIEAQKESLEMLELTVASSNNQMFSTLSKCPKLKTLTLSGYSFSLHGMSLMKCLTNLTIRVPSDSQNQDLPAPQSLPNMKTLEIEANSNYLPIVVSLVAACPSLQSLTVSLWNEEELTRNVIDQIIQNCSNIEILKLISRVKQLRYDQTLFENLSTYCPKIQFLQFENVFILDLQMLMQKHSSLIAIHLSGIIAISKSKLEDIGGIIARFEPRRRKEIHEIEFL